MRRYGLGSPAVDTEEGARTYAVDRDDSESGQDDPGRIADSRFGGRAEGRGHPVRCGQFAEGAGPPADAARRSGRLQVGAGRAGIADLGAS